MLAEPLQPLAVPVDELRSLEGNPRRGDVAAVARSLKRFGQRKPIVARVDGTVVAGNHTLLAARELGWAEIAVVRVDDDEVTAKAYALADNRTSALGSFDLGDLAAMVGEVHAVDPELLAAASFDEDDLNELLAGRTVPAALNDPDDVPEPPAEPVSMLGDLWLLGPHRLLCGDSTDVAALDRLMEGDRADCVWTDPPYGVDYVGKTKDALTIKNDGAQSLEELLRGSLGAALTASEPGAAWYVAAPPGPQTLTFGLVLKELEVFRQVIIWVKDQFVLGHSDYHYRHEPIYYGCAPGPGRRGRGGEGWFGNDAQDTVWEIARPKRSEQHPTMKPVELVTRALGNSTRPGARVLDVFGGSGTTLIACHETRRTARLVELDPRYVDVICRRYQEHTGTKPILEATGEPHDFTA